MSSDMSGHEQLVRVTTPDALLEANLSVPPDANGLVLFAHGSGSSRHSPRNRYVARQLQHAGLATLLIDLLTADEEEEDRVTAKLRFDIDLLTKRLVGATDWAGGHNDIHKLPIGYFGASTGAAAALLAATHRPDAVRAVVSRGGRPDLAGPALRQVRAATLLIVGGDDTVVIALNQSARELLQVTQKRLVIVPGAGHLFEEPGALDAVAQHARQWFRLHLAGT
jgi:pimeloyl-ACP methyl ester carboxylesterase